MDIKLEPQISSQDYSSGMHSVSQRMGLSELIVTAAGQLYLFSILVLMESVLQSKCTQLSDQYGVLNATLNKIDYFINRLYQYKQSFPPERAGVLPFGSASRRGASRSSLEKLERSSSS